jgi:carbon storage regulator
MNPVLQPFRDDRRSSARNYRTCGLRYAKGFASRTRNFTMLVLSRKVGERVWIGDNIAVTIVKVSGNGVRIGIEAPAEMPVIREELKLRLEAEKPATSDEAHSAPR